MSSKGEGAGDKASLPTPVGGKVEAPAAGAETTLRYDRKHKGKEVVFQASKAAEWEVVREVDGRVGHGWIDRRADPHTRIDRLIDRTLPPKSPHDNIMHARTNPNTHTQTEGPRSLKDYMALPPSQYSVLDADAIVRMTDDSFRCQIGGISFFGERLTFLDFISCRSHPRTNAMPRAVTPGPQIDFNTSHPE